MARAAVRYLYFCLKSSNHAGEYLTKGEGIIPAIAHDLYSLNAVWCLRMETPRAQQLHFIRLRRTRTTEGARIEPKAREPQQQLSCRSSPEWSFSSCSSAVVDERSSDWSVVSQLVARFRSVVVWCCEKVRRILAGGGGGASLSVILLKSR